METLRQSAAEQASRPASRTVLPECGENRIPGQAGQPARPAAQALAKAPETNGRMIRGRGRAHRTTAADPFYMDCAFCGRPVRLPTHRFRVLFDHDRRPWCNGCRRDRKFLEVFLE